MRSDARILVTGHRGMVGNAFMRLLGSRHYSNSVGASRKECDFSDLAQVRQLFTRVQPEYVFHFAAKVGGIQANRSEPADFLYENLAIQNNVIRQCVEASVSKLVFL